MNTKTKPHCSESLRCVKWGCENAALIWRITGEWHKSFGGDRTISITGWYCPVCGDGYGDSGYCHSPNTQADRSALEADVERNKTKGKSNEQ